MLDYRILFLSRLSENGEESDSQIDVWTNFIKAWKEKKCRNALFWGIYLRISTGWRNIDDFQFPFRKGLGLKPFVLIFPLTHFLIANRICHKYCGLDLLGVTTPIGKFRANKDSCSFAKKTRNLFDLVISLRRKRSQREKGSPLDIWDICLTFWMTSIFSAQAMSSEQWIPKYSLCETTHYNPFASSNITFRPELERKEIGQVLWEKKILIHDEFYENLFLLFFQLAIPLPSLGLFVPFALCFFFNFGKQSKTS